jgi:hypothetical protein
MKMYGGIEAWFHALLFNLSILDGGEPSNASPQASQTKDKPRNYLSVALQTFGGGPFANFQFLDYLYSR